jgi:hypothetical protein
MDPRFQTTPHTGLVPSGKYAPIRMFLNSYCADYKRTTGDMIFNLRQDISVDQNTEIYMSLREMTVANSEYNITNYNNTLYIHLDGQDYSFDIEPGNYTVTTLINTLNAKFENFTDNTHAQIKVLKDFNVSIHPITNQFTFWNAGTDEKDKFSIYGNDRFATINGTSIMEILGFEYTEDKTKYKSAIIPGIAGLNGLVAPYQCDLSGVNSFFFCTNLHTQNYNFMQENQGRSCNILEKIQMTADVTGINFFENATGFKTRISERTLAFLHLQLFDEDFMPWAPKGKWSAVVEFYFFNSV